MEREHTDQHETGGAGRGSDAPALEERMATLKAGLEEAERERSQFRELLQRVQAEFANYRKRADAERIEQQQYASGRVLLRFIAILDDFDRALAQSERLSGVEGQQRWVEGIRLIYRNLQNLLDSEGVAPIDAKGKPFDPSAHEAVLMQETFEAPEGTVVAVARPGYKHHERILRPAQVVVARAPHATQTDSRPESQKESENG